jgi:hypothetical protein
MEGGSIMRVYKSTIDLKREQIVLKSSNKPSLLILQQIVLGVLSIGFHAHSVKADTPPEKPLGQLTDNLRLTGEFRARYEAYDFFQPAGTNNNNDYDFWGLRARLGLEATSQYVNGYVQGEYSGVYGLPKVYLIMRLQNLGAHWV